MEQGSGFSRKAEEGVWKEERGSAMGLGTDRHTELDQSHLDYHVNGLWEASKAS